MKRLTAFGISTIAFLAQPLAAQTFSQDVIINSSNAAAPNLKVTGPGGVVFFGTHGTGSIPATGDGSRLMWYPKKSAFRAGYVDSGRWDDANIGEHSIGIGANSIAQGFAAVALGSASASGHQSFAAGWGASAAGGMSTALNWSTVSGTAYHSLAAACGTASGYQSVALQGGNAIGNHSVAIGSYATSTAVQSVVVGQFNEILGDPITVASSDPIFVVGTGAGTSQRQNGFAVMRNGDIRMAKRQGDILMGEFGNPGD